MSEQDEKQIEAVQAAKAGYILFGEHYDYPSPSRIRAADCMGKRWPAIGEEGEARRASTGKYPGMLEDIVITLWLATLKHATELTKDEVQQGVWSVEKATLKPTQAKEVAFDWATSNKIAMNEGAAYGEAYVVYWDIIRHQNAVLYKLDVTGANSAPEEQENLV